jgi:hypothetical protein
MFLYLSNTTNKATIHTVPSELNDYLEAGFRKLKPIKNIIEDILWHKENASFTFTRELVENNGVSTITVTPDISTILNYE